MKFSRHIDHGPTWHDPDNLPEERCKLIEEQVDARAKRKTLAECGLPEGFRLVTATPKQFWINKQLTWAFMLGWAPMDRQGVRQSEDLYLSVFRYDWRIADELQMRWAVDEFAGELQGAPHVCKIHTLVAR